jgi:hypothetical protein
MLLNPYNMETLDWGQITPEGANLENNEFYYVFNHDLTSEEKVDRTIRFIVGRLNYYDLHLPAGPKHVIKIDIRGQSIEGSTCDFILERIKNLYHRPDALQLTFVK